MLVIKILGVLLASVLGAFLYRFRGGWPDIPRPIEQALFCAPLLILASLDEGWFGVLLYGLSVAAILRGHGRNADLGDWDKPAKHEWYENNPVMRWLERMLPIYWYDVCGLIVSGLTITLPMIFISLPLAISGALKAPAFMIGKVLAEKLSWKIVLFKGRFQVVTAWEWGEFLCGATLWAVWFTYITAGF